MESSRTRDRTGIPCWQADPYPLYHQGSPDCLSKRIILFIFNKTSYSWLSKVHSVMVPFVFDQTLIITIGQWRHSTEVCIGCTSQIFRMWLVEASYFLVSCEYYLTSFLSIRYMFLKSLLDLLHYCLCFMIWFFGFEACRILPPWPGIEPVSSTWEGKVLTTGPSGKFLNWRLHIYYNYQNP